MFFLFVVFIFYVFTTIKSEIKKLICIWFVHISSIIPENFKDLVLIIQEILEF